MYLRVNYVTNISHTLHSLEQKYKRTYTYQITYNDMYLGIISINLLNINT